MIGGFDMRTQSIIDTLNANFGEQESYSKEQLESITSLTINRFNILNHITEVSCHDLVYFPNLTSLTIQQCIIDEEFIASIKKLGKLSSITFIRCEFEGNYGDLFHMALLRDLCFDGTQVDVSLLNHGIFDTLVFSNMEISEKVEINANRLNISKANVKDWGILDNMIDTLIVSGEQYDNTEALHQYTGHIVVMEDNLQMIREEVNV
jgi:hypothetical protein